MPARRSFDNLSFSLGLRADRSRVEAPKTLAERIERDRARKASVEQFRADREALARAAAADGAVGYRLVANPYVENSFDVTLDGVVVGEAGYDTTAAGWWLTATTPKDRPLPPRFANAYERFSSLPTLRAYLGVRPTLA